MESLYSTVPKPIFVIGDVQEESYVTSLDFYKTISEEVFAICGTNNGTISTWSLSTYRRLNRFNLKDFIINNKDIGLLRISSLIYLHSRHKLLVHLACGNVYLFQFCIYDSNQNQLTSEFRLIMHWQIHHITFSKCFHLEDKYIAFLNQHDSKQIDLTDLDQSKTIKIKTLSTEDHGIVMAIHLFLVNNPNKKFNQSLYVIIAYEDGFLMLFRTFLELCLDETFTHITGNKNITMDLALVSLLRLHVDTITCIDFNERTMCGIGCCVSNEIVIWRINLKTENENTCEAIDQHRIKRIPIQGEGITCCSIRSDGKIFAIGSRDGRIRVFSMKSGKSLAVITYHSDSIETIRFTGNVLNKNDENFKKYLLIATSRNRSISIWSLYNDHT